MFYSQFILAKKGPLGTIWIAAHLERKLRKNQVADTDIGVSVDSILSPDVPIALRLSSHLLLGVVRIYSRKVNYLFDDCSEALLKVKQAFRSTVVDLPPEESKAPYHSITLPETFDLDDFELPDTEIFQGKFVDHHVSTKEQITLQDTMDGVVYSTSQFGLDERFGDGDASQIALDLDEELLLNKGAPSGHGVLLASCADPQTPVEPSSTQKGDELDLEMHDLSQAVATDCCMEGDDLDVEMHDPSQAVATNCCTEDIEKSGPQVGSPSNTQPTELIVSSNIADTSVADEVFESSKDLNPEFDLNGNLGKSELNDGVAKCSGECGEAKEIGSNENMVSLDISDKSPPPSEQADQHHAKSPAMDFYSVSENTSFVDQSSLDPVVDVTCKLDINSNAENKEGQNLISPETSEVANVDAKADMLSVCKPILQPCNFSNNHANAEIAKLVSMPKDFEGSEEMYGTQDAPDVSVPEVPDVTIQDLNEDQFHDADHCNNLDGQPVISENMQFPKATDSAAPELPSPERMRSLPDVPVSQPTVLLVGSTPEREVAQGDQDATMNKISGKKRSLTESTITLQSQNSVESPEAAQSKRSVDFVPDDDDLLSSILVGRRSTVLKVKSTPPAFGLVSSKRPRNTPRSGAHKRKVLVDDSMVLHGDTIRQQLVSTEDIRRVRKKAPSTHPEIWILQKQFLEDEMFNEPIFTGMSSKLISLHGQSFNVSGIKLVQDDGNKAQSTVNDMILSPKRLAVGDETDLEGTGVSSAARDESDLQFAECPLDTPIEQLRVSNDLFCSGLENATMTNSEVVRTHSQFDISENRTELETQFDVSENRTEMETQFDISENRTEMETECRREPVDDDKDHSIAFGIESLSSLPCASENNSDLVSGDMIRSSCFKDTSNANLSEQVDGSCLKLDEHSSGKYTLLAVDNSVEGIGIEEGVDKAAFGDIVEHRPDEGYLEVGLEDADSVVPMPGAHPEYSVPVNDETIIAVDRTFDDGRTHEPGTVNRDDELHESDLKYDEQREDSKVDPSDPVEDVFEHDTDFLNFDDDDEIAEDAEYSIPNAEGSQILDNSGWSTRTRAVANYLQVLFHKEAQHGRTVLRLDNLLANKSRKEASRMFFETLVLKTRDYIHVDEEVPFGNISIKPRARLLKSEF